LKKVFLIFIIFQTLSYPQISKKISVGEISIFTEPSQEEITQWAEYDKFLLDTYYYVKNEKQELESYPMNPFKDSTFIKKHINLTYIDIYKSAKAYRDSLFFKDANYKAYNNINEWAFEKFPSFMRFNLDFNKYLELNH
tara:strand:- start:1781 stop:2197 length:417 start_codon:yes stop_codon:yes gene_type:complete